SPPGAPGPRAASDVGPSAGRSGSSTRQAQDDRVEELRRMVMPQGESARPGARPNDGRAAWPTGMRDASAGAGRGPGGAQPGRRRTPVSDRGERTDITAGGSASEAGTIGSTTIAGRAVDADSAVPNPTRSSYSTSDTAPVRPPAPLDAPDEVAQGRV